MINYVCNECGERFNEPYTYKERHGLECGPYEKWSECPYCGSTDYNEVSIDGRRIDEEC